MTWALIMMGQELTGGDVRQQGLISSLYHACVIRGQVVTSDGTPLVGVNVSFINSPAFGYTITRQDGSFDLVTNGGIAIALHFERAPFITQEHTLWLPWGRFFVMDTIVMRHEENDIPSCDLSSFSRPVPVVSPAPLTAFAGSCSERGTVVPEIQVIFRLPPPHFPAGRT
ncbi:Teneurin-4 [Ataeniobius toweri]|uniref:Teneurin-4 n=1 Tax=Ataeniobius toweri TaxID=208326 RepID=A0ABU7CBA7_9TELE|nr:Teneurin-4 [Ataeniobius toweri]